MAPGTTINVRKHVNSRKLVDRILALGDRGSREASLNQVILSGMLEWFGKQYPEVSVVDYDDGELDTDGYITIPALSSGGLFSSDDQSSALFRDRRILLEVKREKNFSGSVEDRLVVIAQVCSYLYEFRKRGLLVPAVTVIADLDEIFYIPTSALWRIVCDESIDYESKCASDAHLIDGLMGALRDNSNIRPYVHDIRDGFNFNEFFTVVNSVLNLEKLRRIPVNTVNMLSLFDEFSGKVFPDATMKITNQQKIDVFIRSLKGDDEVYIHPKKGNVIVVDGVNLPIDSYQHEVFWSAYDSDSYSLDEIKAITEIADTLIEEVDRRYRGDYWTPTIWVDHAHRLIEKQLGENWREDYVVWDPAAGAKNLTRDYAFGELYSSTLHQEELNIAQWYNGEGVAFQYDFLNDDIQIHKMSRDEVLHAARAGELKMPAGIVEALYENRPFVFFTNPPYGQAVDQGGSKKAKIADTAVGGMMGNLGHAKQELYTQFIYRVQLLAELFDYTENFHFFFFNKGFLTSPSFGKFMDGLTAQFTYRDGFMLNAGEFNGTSSAWGIIFSHWDINEKLDKNQDEFIFDVCASNGDMSIDRVTSWRGRSVARDETLSQWLKSRSPQSSVVDMNAPLTRNGFDAPNSKQPSRCVLYDGWIGYQHNNGCNIQYSDKYVGMYTMGFSGAHGRQVSRENLESAALTFSIRRSVQEVISRRKQLWIRDKDIFTAPPEDLLTPEFTADCMVYSLFDRQSNQTSLRDYEYNGRKYRVVNEFFPFSREEINALAVQHHNLAIQQDLSTDRERIVYQWLQEHGEDLSPEARNVLEYAWFLIEESFPLRGKYRRDRSDDEARYQTNTWDAGWVQVNRLIFGDDRIDDSMLQYRDEWKRKVRVLGDRIAAAAMSAGVI